MHLTDARLLDRIRQMVNSAQYDTIRAKFTTSPTTALLFEELNSFFQQCGLGPEVVVNVTTIFLNEEHQRVWGVNLSSYYRDWETDRKSTRLNSSHRSLSRMPSSA